MTVRGITPQALADLFRASMRIAPASVSLVTRAGSGRWSRSTSEHWREGPGGLSVLRRDSVITNLYRRGGPRLRHPHNFRRANRRHGA